MQIYVIEFFGNLRDVVMVINSKGWADYLFSLSHFPRIPVGHTVAIFRFPHDYDIKSIPNAIDVSDLKLKG